jgi:predicted ATPase
MSTPAPRPPRRIAVTGGPGGGKTSVLGELARTHADRVVIVPEVATVMFAHVFPQVLDGAERCAVQRAIFHVQREVEGVYAARLRPGQVLLCDRGTPDGAGYWPGGQDAFFAAMQSRCEDEFARYDAVLFLETAAAGGLSIASGNATRVEDLATAVEIDRRLLQVWSRHPRLHRVAHRQDFATKIAEARAVLHGWLGAESA